MVKNGLEIKGTGNGDPGREIAGNLKSNPNQRSRQRSNQKPSLQAKDMGLIDACDGEILRSGTGRHAEEIQGGPKYRKTR